MCLTMQVGALFLEILTGFAPLWFITNPEPSQRANIKAQLRRPGTPYAQHLTEDDKTFLELCLERNPGRRLVLAQLLADPWVKQYLGWPAGWKVDGSPPTFLAG
jgi:serine/threonine protein kinase